MLTFSLAIFLICLQAFGTSASKANQTCNEPGILSICTVAAEKVAQLTGLNSSTILPELETLIASTDEQNVTRGCKGLAALVNCYLDMTCTQCSYPDATLVGAGMLLKTSKLSEKCNISASIEQNSFCSASKWKAAHRNQSYPGECLPNQVKLQCVQQSTANASCTNWETGLTSVLQKTLQADQATSACPQLLQLGRCELVAGCNHSCTDQTELEDMFSDWLLSTGSLCAAVSGIDKKELHVDCEDSNSTVTSSSSDTSSSSIVPIVVLLFVVVIIIIGIIVSYCVCPPDDGYGKKKIMKKEKVSITGTKISDKLNAKSSAGSTGKKPSAKKKKSKGGKSSSVASGSKKMA
ncbi:hypothetical protein TYRP_017886 [Tyrophagus putrescentiae]|nr:hypothetical protein TYRP_017886 [Tyrophagus putrescentiae]